MGADGVQYRMSPAGIEVRTDPRELQGCAQKRLAHALAFRREVIGASIGKLVPHGPVDVAAVDELGRQYAAVTHEDAILPELFIDDDEFISAADIEYEVDVPAENVRQRHGSLVGDACGAGRHEQR